MRTILSISLPEKTVMEIKEQSEKLGITVSAYFLKLHEYKKQHLISDEELKALIREADDAYEKGDVKVLSSLRDLI